MSVPETKQTFEKRKQFLDEVKTLDKEEYQEIFRIIKKNNVEFSENSNGVFFDLNQVSDEIFQKLEAFMNYCKTQRSEEKKRSEEIQTIRSEQLKDDST
jgi:DNA integrity scanning protein DisA with diadenylate cyclase activity